MTSDDIRAVENPISAIFDLAEDVNREAPRIRKMVNWATAFVMIWLFIDFAFIVATIGRNLLVGLFLIGLFIMGIMILTLMQHVNDFFRYYALRHRAIMSVRDDDPVVFAPSGADAVQRLYSHLSSRNPNLAYLMVDGGVSQIVKGKSGVFYSFDRHALGRPSWLWRLFGLGYPGYQLFIKLFDSPPRMEDMASLKRSVEDACEANHVPPTRVIALWTRKEDQEISENVYDYILSTVVRSSHRGKRFASSLELVIENEDLSYEFIPYVAESGYFSTSRAQ